MVIFRGGLHVLLCTLSLAAAAEPILLRKRPTTQSSGSPWGGQGSDIAAAALPSFQRPVDLADQLFLKDRILVKMKQQGSKGGQLKLVKLKPGTDVKAAVEAYSNRTDVEYAAYDDLLFLDAVPNDPQFSSQWALQRVGALSVWNTTTGSSNVTVCVIDSGVDYRHPDLAANMSPSLGYSTISKTNDPMDELKHGTHAVGIIGAVGNNGINVTGVNWKVQLLVCKFMDSQKFGSSSDAITCIKYCTSQPGVRIISSSWGGGKQYNSAMAEAIKQAGAKDILFVNSAGNSGVSLDNATNYPASFNLDNMLVVASSGINTTDKLSSFSNYSPNVVHLAAPGEYILSTIPGGTTQYFQGTSMAAPFVTGAAALLLSASNGTLTTAQLRHIIMDSVQPVPLLKGKVVSGGRLSIDGALRLYQEKYASSTR